jgi:Ubiquitin carboxyl-terminal hydrolase
VVPKAAQRFLVASDDKPRSAPNGTATATKGSQESPDPNDGNDSGGRSTNRTTTDMEEVSAGPVPRYGFRLRMTCRDGRRCLTCPWYDCCIGCYVPDDRCQTAVMDGDSLVVDWHFAVDLATSGFGSRSNPNDPASGGASSSSRPKPFELPVRNHSSCGSGVKKPGFGGAITLEDCLDAFAKEEKIPEAYCSKCKDFRVQTKRMSLWRLPPVVIVHLKRFQFTQQMRRKLRDLVIFPTEGLDLSRIMATDSASSSSKSPPKPSPLQPPAADGEGGEAPQENGSGVSPEGIGSASSSSGSLRDSGRDEMLYDLYAVVHHQGALSGGHYVASLKSELDGQWRLFNDAQVYEIHARDVVDASAYILFYIRRDVAKAKLGDYWSVRDDGEAGVTEEDMEKLMNSKSERCSIS